MAQETAGRPTLEAVAAHAGVSRATVSRVVNGGAGVTGPLADRVRAAVAELGYVPNPAARTLVTRRTGAVAVIITEPGTRVFADPFFLRQLRGIEKALGEQDQQLVLMLQDGPEDHDRIARYLAGGHVDGVLAFSLHTDDPLPATIARLGLPVVYGGRPGWSGADVLFVDADNRGGARSALRHLRALGRSRIAHIAGPHDQTSAADRLAGYRDLLPPNAPELVVEGDFTALSGRRAMDELLRLAPDLDGVFVANDLMASGALAALRARRLRVPGDVAVVGFDDVQTVAESTDPPLTTVRQDIEGMGRLMAHLLLGLLGAGPGGLPVRAGGSPVVTRTEVVRRGSA
ncbi:LacI family DNA-binding transcriptional regulator [Streptomyces sp. NPDC006879]|uniref:LacI family DNA-binding transcriptional regulator n=1 Tax=Streptomyces sp. NPDC006879 TaxID=3364767 RepID=UPI0036C829A9